MSKSLTFKCCYSGSQSVEWSNNGIPLVINMQESELHAFDVTAGDAYVAGQIVNFNGVKAIALSSITVTETGTMAFLIGGQVNKALLLKEDGTTPAAAADFTAIMPSINPVSVSG